MQVFLVSKHTQTSEIMEMDRLHNMRFQLTTHNSCYDHKAYSKRYKKNMKTYLAVERYNDDRVKQYKKQRNKYKTKPY